MDNVQMLSLAAFVLIAVRFVAMVTAAQWDSVFKTLLAYAAGIGAVCFYAHTGQADTLAIGGTALSQLNGFDQVLLGIGMGSVAGVAHVAVKSFDKTQSAAQPEIIKTHSPVE